MTRGMRNFLATLLLIIAVGALVGLVAVALGASLGEGARPMLFARALVLSVGLFVVTWCWGRKRKK